MGSSLVDEIRTKGWYFSGRLYAAIDGVLVWVSIVVVGCGGFPAQSGRRTILQPCVSKTTCLSKDDIAKTQLTELLQLASDLANHC